MNDKKKSPQQIRFEKEKERIKKYSYKTTSLTMSPNDAERLKLVK